MHARPIVHNSMHSASDGELAEAGVKGPPASVRGVSKGGAGLTRWPPRVRMRACVTDGDSVPCVYADLLGHVALPAGRRGEDADAASGAAGAMKAPASARREQHEGPVGPSWVMLELGDRVCSCFGCGAVPTKSDEHSCCCACEHSCCCACGYTRNALASAPTRPCCTASGAYLFLSQALPVANKQDAGGLEEEEGDSAGLRPWMEGYTEEFSNEDISTVISLARSSSPTHSPLSPHHPSPRLLPQPPTLCRRALLLSYEQVPLSVRDLNGIDVAAYGVICAEGGGAAIHKSSSVLTAKGPTTRPIIGNTHTSIIFFRRSCELMSCTKTKHEH